MSKHEEKRRQWNNLLSINQYVTDSSIGEVFGWHQLDVPADKLVLYIGVGMSGFIRGLSQTNTIIGVDVSDDCLKAVEPFCKSIHFSKDLNQIEKVDLAICNLVLQHNDEEEVARIINDVNLKDDAIFSFQFASESLKQPIPTTLTRNEIQKKILYLHSLDKMKKIVDNSNKKLVNVIGPMWWGEPFGFDWYIFRVVNK